MEEIALSLVEPIVSPIVGKLMNAALSYFGGDITEEELQDLQTTILPKIRAVLRLAEGKEVDDLKPWLVKLKVAAYEAEDVLDMYEYQRLKAAQVSSAPKFIKTLEKTARAVFAPFTLKTKLKRSIEKLNKIAAEIDQFVPLYSNFTNQDPMNRQQQQHPASVSSPSSQVFGRDIQRDSIINNLISAANEPSTSSGSRIPVLAIYGIGGAGKTTLAQSINKDPRIVKHFDTKMWVHVSRIFDAHAITKKIIESINQGECPPVESLDVLQSILKDKLKSKKFLLVLDDVWCLNKKPWDDMLIPFIEVGEMGSRILITCRAEEVTSKLGVDHVSCCSLLHEQKLKFEILVPHRTNYSKLLYIYYLSSFCFIKSCVWELHGPHARAAAAARPGSARFGSARVTGAGTCPHLRAPNADPIPSPGSG